MARRVVDGTSVSRRLPLTRQSWLLVSVRGLIEPAEYRRIEEETARPNWETYDRICDLFGWPQSFAG
jgi:hypothetical protein